MTEQTTTLTSAAAARGPLAMEAISVSKDFKIDRHQTLHAVRDVSFNLYRGAVVALVGESGSGKSTAARLLAGQERLTSGAIKLDGKPVEVTSRGDFRRYKSQVQYVFQDPFSSLNPVHTVRHHLERPLKLHHGKEREHRHRGRRPDGTGAAHPGEAFPGQVPARAVRRPAPAGRFRPGARRPPDRAAGRRAGVHAGRLDPAGDAEPARRSAPALQPGHAVHHPRHRLGPVLRRRGAGHVRRRDRGARPGRGGHPAAGPSLHAAARRLVPGPRQPRQHVAPRCQRDPAPGPAANQNSGAGGDSRLPVQSQVPARRGPLPGGGPDPPAHHGHAGRGLLAPGRSRSGARPGPAGRRTHNPKSKPTPPNTREKDETDEEIAQS